MSDFNPSIALEDSKGNKYFFYYRDFSIYYREVQNSGNTKDTILISQANPDFTAVLDTDDSIYLTCNSRYKGVLLFTYVNMGWRFESVVSLSNSSNIYIMDMLVQNGSIHIFFAKRLPVANLYNVYHLQKKLNEQLPYIEYSWKKNSISEIYSQNIENSFSIISSKGGMIHYASVWHDGTLYFINYYCYDDSIKYWIHKSLNISFKNQVSIKLMNYGKRIKLLCFSNSNEAGSNIHHFSAKASGGTDIDFRDGDSAFVNTDGAIPLFFHDDKAIQLAWLKDNVFHQYTYDDAAAKWRKTLVLPITAETNIHLLKLSRNSGSITSTKGYYILDSSYRISRPVQQLPISAIEERPEVKSHMAAAPEANDYLKQILHEIKALSDNIQKLNMRIAELETADYARKSPDIVNEDALPQGTGFSEPDHGIRPLKKTNFKEKFMKSEKTPSYDKLLIKQDNIMTYVGKPTSSNSINTASQKSKSDPAAIEKQAFASPEPGSESENSDKSNGIIHRIGEFFK